MEIEMKMETEMETETETETETEMETEIEMEPKSLQCCCSIIGVLLLSACLWGQWWSYLLESR